MLKRLCGYNKLKAGNLHEENQYLNLLHDISLNGIAEEGRNGITTAVFGTAMHFSLKNNTIPILTTKKVAWRTCLRELLWFIKGDTDNKNLKAQNVHIWDANASRDFLDSRGLTHREEDDLGPIYGFQWRHFNAPYTDCHADYTEKGVDQLKWIIEQLQNEKTRTSRRLILSAWNPCQLKEMALPPCHVLAQFSVINNKLSCSLYQRSGDMGLGVPFNIASYSFLTHLIARHCGLEAEDFFYHIGNAHIYDDHYEVLKQQYKLKPFNFPKISIIQQQDNIEDYTMEDIKIIDYESHGKLTMAMRK